MINADVKLPLIDLEVSNITTGRKQDLISVQRERLSEGDNMYTVYWIKHSTHTNVMLEGYVGVTKNLEERIKGHKKPSSKNVIIKNAIRKYGWDNLVVEILHSNLTVEEALQKEGFYRPTPKIGWNSKTGGILGNDSAWYLDNENSLNHKERTSLNTKKGIQEKDTTEKRSIRAKIARTKSDNFNDNKGSNNPRATLNECDVCEIRNNYLSKYTLMEIAVKFNTTKYVIWSIKSGRSWSHIVCDSPDPDKQVDDAYRGMV